MGQTYLVSQVTEDPDAGANVRGRVMSPGELFVEEVADALRQSRSLGVVAAGCDHSWGRRQIHDRCGMGHCAEERARREPDLTGDTQSQDRHDLNVEVHVVSNDAVNGSGFLGEPIEYLKWFHAVADGHLQLYAMRLEGLG